MPDNVISGMLLAAITRTSFGDRAAWWDKLDLRFMARLFRVPSAAPPAVELPFESPLPCSPLLSPVVELDVPQNRLASFAQPDVRGPVCGVKSFAGTSVHGNVANRAAGLQISLRMPEFSGLDSLLDSGLRSPVAGRDVASTAAGESIKETHD